MSQPKVVFVDDDSFYSMRWIEKLREHFEVQHISDALVARATLDATLDARCVILDLMMPRPSIATDEETAGGLETGLWLLRGISKLVVSRPLPIIVLTNRESPDLANRIAKFDFPEGLVVVRRKLETNRQHLLELVRDMVTRWNRPRA